VTSVASVLLLSLYYNSFQIKPPKFAAIRSMKRTILSFLTFLILIKLEISTVGCANMIPPTGGPRDSIPPALVHVRPGDSARNFNSKRIVFEFNEYIQLDNATTNVLVSPTPKGTPSYNSHLRTLTVEFHNKDTLDPNTTYSINFGNAIKDVNEGNVMKNFTYIFSTGSSLDSLIVSGKVIIAETGKTDSTLIAVLYRNLDDSAVYKENPRYITRLNHDGTFTFRNLPSGVFALYVLQADAKRYQSKADVFAFSDSVVNPSINPKPITLYAYVEEKKEDNQGAGAGAATNISGRNTRGIANQDKRLRLETNLANGELDLLQQLEFNFRQAPLKYFDSTKVRFTTDSFQNITNYRIIRDTSNKKITLQYNWRENTGYRIIVDKDFAEDTAGRKITRNDTLTFKTKKLSEYGSIKLRLLNLDMSKNPVLLFTQNDQIKASFPLTSQQLNVPIFIPGEYDLRILFDENKNGKWDPGKYWEGKKQPEKVIIIPRRLNVKTNWDNEVDITL
jgi:Big-like domain-containing protein